MLPGVKSYIECTSGKVKNIYKPVVYLNSISMFGHVKKEKKVSPKKQLKLDLKAKKQELKKSVKAEKAAKKVEKVENVAVKSGKKAISRLAVAGSRVVGSGVAFLGAAAYNSYRLVGISAHSTMIYAGATVGASLLAAAPYAKSVARTNRQLMSVDTKLTQVDEMIGSQKELVEAAIASLESASQKPNVSQVDLMDIKNELSKLHKKFDAIQATPAKVEVPDRVVHVAPAKEKPNSVIAR